MLKPYIENQKIENQDFALTPFNKGDYEQCTFVNCNFSEVDLGTANFSECEFVGCNLSMASLEKTTLNEVHFSQCKLLGMRFEQCNTFLFTVSFSNCVLNHSSFYKLNTKSTRFEHCTMYEIEFTETNLTAATFDNCDLSGTTFMRSNLEKANFITSRNFNIDPEQNKVKHAKFATAQLALLLGKYNLHIE